ncbi:MAG: VOC family protein [Pseudomonadota bacterium]
MSVVTSGQISLVTIVVPSYEAGLAFYVGTLGWDLRSNEDQGQGKRWVVVAPSGSHCAILLAAAASAQQTAAIGAQTGGRVGFFLTVSDFRETYQKMCNAGVMFEEAPRQEPYGTVAVWQDPFGNRWDLLERHAK